MLNVRTAATYPQVSADYGRVGMVRAHLSKVHSGFESPQEFVLIVCLDIMRI